MNIYDDLNDENFVLFAAKFYDNPSCMSVDEFNNDLNRIKYIKRLLKKYHETGDLKERLILNHLVTLYNIFENRACTRMLTYKLSDYLVYIKPFLVYLGFWYDDKDGIIMDQKIIKRLREV